MTTSIIATLHNTAAAVQILGIWLTVNGYMREHSPGLWDFYIPSGWKARRGPLIITAGIIIGSIPDVAPLLIR